MGAPEGWPDISGWLPRRADGHLDGRILGIETKRPGEKPTELQIDWMRRINADGGAAFWCDDVVACQATIVKLRLGWSVWMDEKGEWRLIEP
jgi:hypothetical protein